MDGLQVTWRAAAPQIALAIHQLESGQEAVALVGIRMRIALFGEESLVFSPMRMNDFSHAHFPKIIHDSIESATSTF